MYTLIDRTNMRFFGKHPDGRQLSKLAFIELPHVAVITLECDRASDFETFTDLELRLLFKHTTESDPTTANRSQMLAMCVALAQDVPMSDLNGFELDAQMGWIPQGDEQRYRYVRGASKPALQGELWEPVALKTELRWDPGRMQALQQAAVVAAPVAPAHPRSPAVPPASTPRTPAPPRGGLRQVVWDAMDRIWSEAGRPEGLKTILALRKTCMDTLEQQGCKRTSVSSELGNWQKERCPAAQ